MKRTTEKKKTNKKARIAGLVITLTIIISLILTFTFAYAGEYVSRYTKTTYNQNEMFDNYIISNGIDVSAYQENMDWAKIKASGIDYAIIRVGWTGQTTGKMYEDNLFRSHIAGAKEAGLMIGLYYYSQATTVQEAKEEADLSVSILNDAGYSLEDLDLPIFMDYEKASSSNGRINNLTKTKRTKCANAFLQEITLLGYTPGIYTDYSFGRNSVDGATISENYFYWAAQYYTMCQFEFNYQMWQYSSSGSVPGSTKRTDMNFWYVNPNPVSHATEDSVITTMDEFGNEYNQFVAGKKSLANAKVSLSKTSYTYDNGKSFKPTATVTVDGARLTEGQDYLLRYIGNTQAGTAYCYVKGIGDYVDYAVAPFTINKSTDLSGITISEIADKTYKGSTTKPSSITVKDASGNTLIKGIDYTFTASNATNVGTAKVNVSFIGNYDGKKTATYNIVKASQEINVENEVKTIEISKAEDFNLGASSNFSEATFSYKTSDEKIATVSQDGTIHFLTHGTVTVTVTANETKNLKEATYSFTIVVKAPPQEITTAKSEYSKDETAGSFNLNAETNGDGELSYYVEVLTSEKEYAEGDDTADFEYDEGVEEGSENLILGSESDDVIRVSSSGRVILLNPGTAIIHIVAEETQFFEAGEKQVNVTVNAVDPETKDEKVQTITDAVKSIKITSLTASATKGAVTLKWTKSKGKYGVDCFRIFRSTKKNSGFAKIGETKTGKVYSFKDTTVTKKNKTYYYRVKGVRYIDGVAVFSEYKTISVISK